MKERSAQSEDTDIVATDATTTDTAFGGVATGATAATATATTTTVTTNLGYEFLSVAAVVQRSQRCRNLSLFAENAVDS